MFTDSLLNSDPALIYQIEKYLLFSVSPELISIVPKGVQVPSSVGESLVPSQDYYPG